MAIEGMAISAILLLILASPYWPVPAQSPGGNKAINLCTNSDKRVANLPFARGKSFCSLDQYLAHLEAQGAIDLPWWREVSPGVYEQVKRMPGAQREVATRAELEKRFGFSN